MIEAYAAPTDLPALNHSSPITTYAYDLNNNLTSWTDPRGVSGFQTFDALLGNVCVMSRANVSNSQKAGLLQQLVDALAIHFCPRTKAYHELWISDPTSGERRLAGGGAPDEEPIYGPTYLPRKFKTAIGLPEDNCVDLHANDLGLMAIHTAQRIEGYSVLVGGGMGVTPSAEKTFPALAQKLTFVRPDQVLDVATAIVKVQRDFGNRADRKIVFDNFWGAWKPYEGTIGANLSNQVAEEIASAKARHYPDALAAATFPDNMPETVYRTLVKEANAGLPTLHRYFKLRAKLLGVKDMAYYDIYPPLFVIDQKYDVPKSQELTLAALNNLGPEYLGLLKKGWAGRWMNVYPHEGKANGGYMNNGAYDVHPYLLLNHNDDYDSLSTFAHEWGHAVHTMLTTESQPYEKAGYSTFIAETASIMNEMLLVDYMIAHAKTKQEKLAYLSEALESVRGTFFRQTMFAEFQLKLHEEVEAGRPLSGGRITELYCDVLKRYHGDAKGVVKIDPAYCDEWMFIPHFYYGFYVYQYATSMSGAALLAKRIETGDPKERDTFIAMLKKGGGEYPYDIYKEAGIDMATPAPYRALIARMNSIMDQIEKLERTK